MRYIICMITSLIMGCGSSGNQNPAPPSDSTDEGGVTPPAPSPPTTSPSFADDIQPLMFANCALSGCHPKDPHFSSAEGLLASSSRQRIINGTMPPRYSAVYDQWTPAKRALVLKWFDDKL